MKIKTIKSQYRRDFTAIYQCEHCQYEFESSGYDDTNFHQNVIPSMTCPECGRKAKDDYAPMSTKYPDGMAI